MAKFSERYGYTPVRTALQQEELDSNLRVDLWNLIYIPTAHAPAYSREFRPWVYIWVEVWRKPIDDLPIETRAMTSQVKRTVQGGEWFDVLDIVESYIGAVDSDQRDDLVDAFNFVLEKNLSAYRVVDNSVVKMHEDTDIEAIEQALTDSADLSGAKRHLQQALHLLSDRQSPDYANSVKESISAVEAVCQHLSGKKRATLTDGIRALRERGVVIHAALEKSWISAYGYTSDADGIRHALISETSLDQETARYFLVTCSAFVSLLLSRAGEAAGQYS